MAREQAGEAGSRALEQLKARAEQQAAVAKLSQRVLEMPEPQELYDAAVLLCAKALGSHVVGLLEVAPDSSDLRLLSILGMPVSPGSLLPRERFPVPTLTIENMAPVLIDDWREGENAQLHSPLIGAAAAISTASVPLIRAGQAVGALVAHRNERRPFDEQDVSFLLSVANLIADYGERRTLFTRLQLSDRLAAVGTLASGVAHEMNNPLTYVLANLQFLDDELRAVGASSGTTNELKRALEALREAREGAVRLGTIVRDLRTFSIGDGEVPTLVSLAPIVSSAINVVQSELRSKARLTQDITPVPMVRGNAARLGQVCLNLLANATQAIAPGHPEQNQVAVTLRASDAGEVLLEVKDSGCGIGRANLKRIFDPFFTTKGPGIGTGLGLSICHGIVKSMGGRIEVESEPGNGSTFRILLPAAPGLVPKSGEVPPLNPPRGRLLLVDDEPLVGMALRRALLAEHDVVLVQSGRAALEQLADQPFDALISDLVMPEMGGLELHDEACKRQPVLSARTLFITGSSLADALQELSERPGFSLLQKPIEVEALRQAVRKLVAQ
jgi:signal transduction histidine kinase/CheY-like chemotaxis protein